MKPLFRVALASFRSVVFNAGLTLLALGLTCCATRRVEKEQQITGIPQPSATHRVEKERQVTGIPQSSATRRVEKEQRITGIPQPDRWREFVAQAARGEIEEVSDGPQERVVTSHGVSPRGRAVPAARARAAMPSEVFSGAFRPEAKTSYATRETEKRTQVDMLMGSLPTDMQMTQMHHELVTKDKNHQNHESRIDLETRNVTVKAWLYWVGHQTDNDFHLVIGDTSELTSTTVFMNSEVSGLPLARPTQQPFMDLRRKLRQLIADNANKNGAFVTPVPVQIKGSLLWDGEHRNPHNVGPKKPVDIRPTKAWEIHPIRDLK